MSVAGSSQSVDMVPIEDFSSNGDLEVSDDGYITFKSVDGSGESIKVPKDNLDFSLPSQTLCAQDGSVYKLFLQRKSVEDAKAQQYRRRGIESVAFTVIEDSFQKEEDGEVHFLWENYPGNPDGPALLFFDLYKTYRLMVGRKFKSLDGMFAHIANEMHAKNYKVSAGQVRSRYRTLERRMKTYTKRNFAKNSSGRGHKPLQYESYMMDMFGEKRNLVPEVLTGRYGVNERSAMLTEAGITPPASEDQGKGSSGSVAGFQESSAPVSTSETQMASPKVRDGKTAITINALKDALLQQNSLLEKKKKEQSVTQRKLMNLLRQDVIEKRRKNNIEVMKVMLMQKKLQIQKAAMEVLKRSDPEKFKDLILSDFEDVDEEPPVEDLAEDFQDEDEDDNLEGPC